MRQQLQVAIREFAATLADRAKRLSNSPLWGDLPATAAAFHAVVDGDPLRMPEQLGIAYARLLRLGRFLETNSRVRDDPMQEHDPLDPDIHGLLTDLVRTAAPWLRGFPTVAAWDDAAGKALVRAEPLPASPRLRPDRPQAADHPREGRGRDGAAGRRRRTSTTYQGRRPATGPSVGRGT